VLCGNKFYRTRFCPLSCLITKIKTVVIHVEKFCSGGGAVGGEFELMKYSTQIINTRGYLNFAETCIYSKAGFFGQSDRQLLSYAKADHPIFSRSFLFLVKSVISTAPLSIRKR